MTAQEKIKALMKWDKMNLWDFAEFHDLDIGTLCTVMIEDELCPIDMMIAVNDHIEGRGLCPVCLSRTVSLDVGRACPCGWSIRN